MRKFLLVLAGLVWLNASYALVVIANNVPWQKVSDNTWIRHIDSVSGRVIFSIKLSNRTVMMRVTALCPNSKRHQIFAWVENQTHSEGTNCDGVSERRPIIDLEPWFYPFPQEVLEKTGEKKRKTYI